MITTCISRITWKRREAISIYILCYDIAWFTFPDTVYQKKKSKVLMIKYIFNDNRKRERERGEM